MHDFLEQCEVGTIFALPWMITWFGHVLPDYEDVVRLYDFFLSKVSEHLGNACGQVKISSISGFRENVMRAHATSAALC